MKKLLVFVCYIILTLPSQSHGERLNFHLGIADIEQLSGKPFNLETLKTVPMYLYMGDQDTNDQVPYSDAYDEEQRELVNRLFGDTPIERWPHAENIYQHQGFKSQFVLYPGVEHSITPQMVLDIGLFFKANGTTNVAPGQSDFRVIKISPADSNKNFDWPYYLRIPIFSQAITTTLLVEPNNTGTGSDDPAVHDQAAYQLVIGGAGRVLADELKIPLLVPTFPRPYTEWQVYTHALDRETLTTQLDKLVRIDLQLIEMIKDARERLEAYNVHVGAKVLMTGFSASGSFVNRFTFLHPNMVQAAAIGSPGGWPIAPVAYWPPGSGRLSLPFIPLLLGGQQ